MRVGIDIRVLGSPYKSGIEEYTENLLAHMLPDNPDIKFKLFYSGNPELLKKYSWLGLDNVELFQSPFSGKFTFAFARLFGYPKLDDVVGGVDPERSREGSQRASASYGVEAFFSPHFLLAPLNSYCRRVMTFHDLSYLRFREFFSLRRDLWHRFQIHSFGKKNLPDRIIAVSESTKKDIVECYGIEPERITIIYSGISPNIWTPDVRLTSGVVNELEEFRKKNELPREFILFLGKLEPRKNVPALVRAFNLIKSSEGFEDLNLVVVGAKGWLFEDVFKEAEMSPYRSKIIFKDHVADEDKKFYYSLASAFIYTSFFEGFGFPPLEAMACGTPVIVSNNSSLPEVVGDAGLLVDPYNAVDISNGVKAVMGDPNLRNALIKSGYERVGMFDWKKCAEQTLAAILGK